MASTIYDYLLKRKTDLETRMHEAQRRAVAPFEDELKALGLAITAIERGSLGEGIERETASFAPITRRGRKGRSAREMILLVLGRGDAAIAASEISRKLTRRWGRAIPLAAVMTELHELEQEGLVRHCNRGWVRLDEPSETVTPFQISA